MVNEKMIENHKVLLQRLEDFCFGNGNKGANKRLDLVEDIVNGKEECNAMREINKHLYWHEKMSGRRWELYVGFILVIVAQVISLVLLGGK